MTLRSTCQGTNGLFSFASFNFAFTFFSLANLILIYCHSCSCPLSLLSTHDGETMQNEFITFSGNRWKDRAGSCTWGSCTACRNSMSVSLWPITETLLSRMDSSNYCAIKWVSEDFYFHPSIHPIPFLSLSLPAQYRKIPQISHAPNTLSLSTRTHTKCTCEPQLNSYISWGIPSLTNSLAQPNPVDLR